MATPLCTRTPRQRLFRNHSRRRGPAARNAFGATETALGSDRPSRHAAPTGRRDSSGAQALAHSLGHRRSRGGWRSCRGPCGISAPPPPSRRSSSRPTCRTPKFNTTAAETTVRRLARTAVSTSIQCRSRWLIGMHPNLCLPGFRLGGGIGHLSRARVGHFYQAPIGNLYKRFITGWYTCECKFADSRQGRSEALVQRFKVNRSGAFSSPHSPVAPL